MEIREVTGGLEFGKKRRFRRGDGVHSGSAAACERRMKLREGVGVGGKWAASMYFSFLKSANTLCKELASLPVNGKPLQIGTKSLKKSPKWKKTRMH